MLAASVCSGVGRLYCPISVGRRWQCGGRLVLYGWRSIYLFVGIYGCVFIQLPCFSISIFIRVGGWVVMAGSVPMASLSGEGTYGY